MKNGKAPLRTFGDLMQFYQAKSTTEEQPKKSTDVQTAANKPKARAPELQPPDTPVGPIADEDTHIAAIPPAEPELSATADPSPEQNNTPPTATPEIDAPDVAPE
jgi:hypothetical protein